MAVNVSNRTGNIKNKRSHALNTTKTKQNLNLQVFKENGKKVRKSTKEKRTELKNKKAA